MFISVDGKAKEVVDIFVGLADGKAHRITEVFGSVNGVAKQVYSLEKETNAFNRFTWSEIKQLANAGQLLEYFNLYDKFVIKLKEPLIQKVGILSNVEVVQNEMMFQIVELTATKMRLMCPRASALIGSSKIIKTTKNLSTSDQHWFYFAEAWENGNTTALSNVKNAWGLTEAYTRLKALDNAFPDDFRDVLSVAARPLTSWTKNSITNKNVLTYDEDMKVRQVTDTGTLKRHIDDSDPNCLVPVIEKSYFPSSVTEFTYYLNLPEEYDTYEKRKSLANSAHFGQFSLFDYEYKKIETSYNNFEYRIKRTCTDYPYASCYFEKGITTNNEYNKYLSSGTKQNDYDYIIPDTYGLFPEVVIAADSETNI